MFARNPELCYLSRNESDGRALHVATFGKATYERSSRLLFVYPHKAQVLLCFATMLRLLLRGSKTATAPVIAAIRASTCQMRVSKPSAPYG